MSEPDYEALNVEMNAKIDAQISDVSRGIDRLKAENAVIEAKLELAREALEQIRDADGGVAYGVARTIAEAALFAIREAKP